jgi:hypothetical protein
MPESLSVAKKGKGGKKRPARRRTVDGLAADPQNGLLIRPEQDPTARLVALIGDDGLKEALSASDDPRAEALLGMFSDKAFAGHSLSAMRIRAGLSVADIVELFRNQKVMEATIGLAARAPQLLSDLADDAMSKDQPCRTCRGFGSILAPDSEQGTLPCPPCSGRGTVRVPGDTDARKIVFEVLGMAGKKGPMVQVNTQNNFGSGMPQSSTIIRQTDHLLESPED